MHVQTLPFTLIDAYLIAPEVKHFIFKSDATPVFDYLPGQFITLHFEKEGKTLKRSYSIANEPRKDNHIEFAAGYVPGGPGSELLFNLKPGDIIHLNGPFGRLILKDELPKRYIFVATRTGVTPYRAMLTELGKRLEQHPELEVVILQGVQKRQDILYAHEFLDFAKKYSRVTFRAYLSRENSQGLGQHEYLGYVQHAFPELNLAREHDVVYLCGNPGMIDDAFHDLQERGFALAHIIREKYISR